MRKRGENGLEDLRFWVCGESIGFFAVGQPWAVGNWVIVDAVRVVKGREAVFICRDAIVA